MNFDIVEFEYCNVLTCARMLYIRLQGIESVEGITVGARCQVMPGARRGVVMFIGAIDQLKPGHWVSEFGLSRVISNCCEHELMLNNFRCCILDLR